MTTPISLLFLLLAPAAAELIDGAKIRIHKGPDNPRLVDKKGGLLLDEKSRKLSFQSPDHSFEAPFDSVRKIIFDRSTHRRGGTSGKLLGGIVGAILTEKKVTDYWMYLQLSSASHMLEIPADAAPALIAQCRSVFPDLTSEAEVQTGEEIKRSTLPDLKSKHNLKLDYKDRPQPELQPGKALVVVVCPPPSARESGHGLQIKVHANDKVVLVNKPGSYGFVHLDPGQYRIASQSATASALTLQLEAGQAYYFLQDSFSESGALTQLSRHSPELVLHELSGAAFARWDRKPTK